MRIAQMIQTLGVGGAEQLALEISGALADEGFESHLIVMDGSGPLAKRRHPAVIYHDLKLEFVTSPGGRLRTFSHLHRKLKGIISTHDIQVLQTHLPMANFLGLTLGWSNVTKVFPTIHNNREFSYGENVGFLRNSLRRLAYGQMLRYTAGMVGVSSAVKDAMVESLHAGPSLADRIHVVPNGVPLSDLPQKTEKEEARKKLGIPENCMVFASVGRLSKQKNFMDLVEACALLDESFVDWFCMIGGVGPLEGELRTQIQGKGLADKIVLAGYLDDPGLLYRAADIFVMPSLWEGLPMALLEAMAVGLPVVGYSIAGLREVIKSGQNGLLVPVNEISKLSECLVEMTGNSSRTKEMGAEARKLIEARYSFSNVVSQLTKIYSESLNF